MAMRGGSISIATVRMRMERLEERTNNTILPPIEDLFRSTEPDPELTKKVVSTMTFVSYPGAKEASTSTIKALLGNTKNLKEMRESGAMGSLLEVIRRTDIKADPHTEHVTNLVESLYTLLENDNDVMARLIAHPFGTKTIVRLCKYTQSKLQTKCFTMLEWIHHTDNGPLELLKLNILNVLLHPTFMFKKTTTIDVRHRSTHMISQITPFSPNNFNIDHFNKLLVDINLPDRSGNVGLALQPGGIHSVGKRRVDGYMEMQLLSSFLSHMSWRDRHNKGFLPKLLTVVSYLIDEVKSESFESVEHMQQIMRILVVLSSDYKHADYMWNNNLGSALQYLVRTDFSLFRKKAVKSNNNDDMGICGYLLEA